MKILITTEFYLPLICGVTTAVLNQKKALEEKGHEVRILTINNKNNSYFEDDVYYVRSNLSKLYKDSNATIAFNDPILKDVYAWTPDIVHAQCEFFTMVFAKKIARKCNAPLLLTCHTDFDAYGIHFMKNQNLWKKITRFFVPKLIRKASILIAGTQKQYDLLTDYKVKNDKIIIPVGLDLEAYKKKLPSETRTQMRAEYGFTEDEVVLVSVCRLSAEKNVRETIDNFKYLIKSIPYCKLLIVGDGTEKENLEKQVHELELNDYVKFTGGVDMYDVWKYFQLGDIFVSSSLSETQGLTYIEALASSLPIVCRKDDALDLSLIYGVNGYDFTDRNEFIEHITQLIENKEQRISMGQAALDSVDKYSIPHFGENLIEVYDKLLKQNNSN